MTFRFMLIILVLALAVAVTGCASASKKVHGPVEFSCKIFGSTGALMAVIRGEAESMDEASAIAAEVTNKLSLNGILLDASFKCDEVGHE